MIDIVLFTYIISIISLAISLYVAIEVYYIKKSLETKAKQRPRQVVQSNKNRGKGHWD